MMPSGSCATICSAASPMQGAVFRPHGSRRIFAAGSAGSCFCVCAACDLLVTTHDRSMGIQAPTRLNVAASSVSSPKSCKNCFGSAARLWGQNRVPLPPAITTACNMLDSPRSVEKRGFRKSLCPV